MSIGTGIAIAGVWIFAAAGWTSKQVSQMGMWVTLFIAIGVTVYLTVDK